MAAALSSAAFRTTAATGKLNMLQVELIRAQPADLCVVRPECCGLVGDELVDERGVDERLECLRGIKSLEPLSPRRPSSRSMIYAGAVEEGSGSLKQQRKREKAGRRDCVIDLHMVNQSQAGQKSFEKLREKRGHMVGFISNLAPLLNYLRRRSPVPPFPPNSRQAGGDGGLSYVSGKRNRRCVIHFLQLLFTISLSAQATLCGSLEEAA